MRLLVGRWGETSECTRMANWFSKQRASERQGSNPHPRKLQWEGQFGRAKFGLNRSICYGGETNKQTNTSFIFKSRSTSYTYVRALRKEKKVTVKCICIWRAFDIITAALQLHLWWNCELTEKKKDHGCNSSNYWNECLLVGQNKCGLSLAVFKVSSSVAFHVLCRLAQDMSLSRMRNATPTTMPLTRQKLGKLRLS